MRLVPAFLTVMMCTDEWDTIVRTGSNESDRFPRGVKRRFRLKIGSSSSTHWILRHGLRGSLRQRTRIRHLPRRSHR